MPDPSTELNFELQMDPVYLDHLNKDFFPNKNQQTYISNVVCHFALCLIFLQINPIKRWLSEQDAFLAKFHWLEGCGDCSLVACLHCGEMENSPALYHCIDCGSVELMCQSCMVLSHKINLLHHVKVLFYFLLWYTMKQCSSFIYRFGLVTLISKRSP